MLAWRNNDGENSAWQWRKPAESEMASANVKRRARLGGSPKSAAGEMASVTGGVMKTGQRPKA
jgi:hypothetical protein